MPERPPPPPPGRPNPQDPRRRPVPPPKIVIRTPGAAQSQRAAPPSPPKAPDPGPADRTQFKGVRILRWQFSVLGLSFLGASVAILAATIVITYLAVVRMGVNSNFSHGLHLHSSNQSQQALSELKDALWWDPDWHWARELRAAILAEGDGLAEAEQEYRVLSGRGYRAGTIAAGEGAISLRRADQEKDAVKSVQLAETARTRYQGAPAAESKAGVALATLLIGMRTSNRARLVEARVLFEQALASADAKTTRQGLVDLYHGYGLCLALLGEQMEAAYGYFRRAANFEPLWETPLANAYMAAALNWWRSPPSPDAIRANLPRYLELLDAENLKVQQTQLYPNLKRPWSLMAMSLARLAARAGNLDKFSELVGKVYYTKIDHPRARKLRAAILSETFDPADMSQDATAVGRHVVAGFADVIQEESFSDEEGRRVRALAANNLAVAHEFLEAKRRTFGELWRASREALARALELDPGCVPALVNTAVLQQRVARLARNPDVQAQARREAQRALDELSKILESRPDEGLRERLERLRGAGR